MGHVASLRKSVHRQRRSPQDDFMWIPIWWLNQSIWKICLSTWIMKPQPFGVKNKHYLKLATNQISCWKINKFPLPYHGIFWYIYRSINGRLIFFGGFSWIRKYTKIVPWESVMGFRDVSPRYPGLPTLKWWRISGNAWIRQRLG